MSAYSRRSKEWIKCPSASMLFVEITCTYMFGLTRSCLIRASAVVGEIHEEKDKSIDFSRLKADSLKQVRHFSPHPVTKSAYLLHSSRIKQRISLPTSVQTSSSLSPPHTLRNVAESAGLIAGASHVQQHFMCPLS